MAWPRQIRPIGRRLRRVVGQRHHRTPASYELVLKECCVLPKRFGSQRIPSAARANAECVCRSRSSSTIPSCAPQRYSPPMCSEYTSAYEQCRAQPASRRNVPPAGICPGMAEYAPDDFIVYAFYATNASIAPRSQRFAIDSGVADHRLLPQQKQSAEQLTASKKKKT